MKKISTLLKVDLMKLSQFPELKQIIEEVQSYYQKADNKEMYVEISKQSINEIVDMLSQVAPKALPNQENENKKLPKKDTTLKTSTSLKKPVKKSDDRNVSKKEKELTKALEECQKENDDQKRKKSNITKTGSLGTEKHQKPKAPNKTRLSPQKANEEGNKTNFVSKAKTSMSNQAIKMDEELIKDKIEQHLLAIIKIPGLKPFTTPAKAEQLKKITISYFNELLPALGLKSLKRDQKTFEKLIDELLEKHGASHLRQLASQWKDEMPEIDFIEKHEKKFYNQRLTDESNNILSILKKANSLLSQNMAGSAAEYLAEHLSDKQIEVYLPAYIKQLF